VIVRRGRGLGPRVVLIVATSLAVACRRAESPSASPGAARRIVSLAPNLTEIVFAVGAGDRLIGVSDFSDFPPAAQKIPRVGGLDVSAERVASLAPDLVLATPEGNGRGTVAALAAAGVPVLSVPGDSLDAVLASIRTIGARVGRAQAARSLVEELAARRARVLASVAGKPRPGVLVLIWPDPPQAAGGGTFLDDVVTEAGGRNLVGDRPGWPLLSVEWLATHPIGVLVVPDSAATRGAYERAFASGPLSRGAVARARVLRIDESTLTRPGPRVFDALELLARELPR
jgi:iron complex transport system substrate-binding protein